MPDTITKYFIVNYRNYAILSDFVGHIGFRSPYQKFEFRNEFLDPNLVRFDILYINVH